MPQHLKQKAIQFMNLLIEISSEEIPARMQFDAIANANKVMTDILKDIELTHSSVDVYVSSRRVAMIIKDVALQTLAQNVEKRGPKITAPKQALDGFLNAVNMTQEQLRVAGDYYFADIEIPARTTTELLPTIVDRFLTDMPWPKAMRWYNPKTRQHTRTWVRPIRGITVVLGDKPVVFDVADLEITTSHQTQGHRFYKPTTITVNHADTYLQQLQDNFVITSFEERRAFLLNAIETACKAKGLTLIEDSALLDEVTGLVDFPFVQIGKIDEKFMQLPAQVLSTSMRVHQKYFSVQTSNGEFAPYFVVATNVPCEGEKSLMLHGFERVLTARLTDALFFFETDLKRPLQDLCERYKKVVFHEKLGTLADKIKRIEFMIESSAQLLDIKTDQDIALLKRACELSKADLFTTMVGEFAELQGIMGNIYAKRQGEDEKVADALQYHYQPLGPTRSIPSRPISRALALLDKLDTLVGFIGHDVKPTGNKDPLAIRRTALGILRLLVEWKGSSRVIENPIEDQITSQLIDSSIDAYAKAGFTLTQHVKEEVLSFMQGRFQVMQKSQTN